MADEEELVEALEESIRVLIRDELEPIEDALGQINARLLMLMSYFSGVFRAEREN